jgi:hypothetical protein
LIDIASARKVSGSSREVNEGICKSHDRYS